MIMQGHYAGYTSDMPFLQKWSNEHVTKDVTLSQSCKMERK